MFPSSPATFLSSYSCVVSYSRQIRPPIYSMKQSKLRRRRVVRYAILYFVLLILFVALIAGPIVAGKFLDLKSFAKQIPMNLMQPNQNATERNNTLGEKKTGTGRPGYPSSTALDINALGAALKNKDSKRDFGGGVLF